MKFEYIHPHPTILDLTYNLLSYCERVEPNEAWELLNLFDTTKSPGPDGINPKVLFELKDEMAYPISMISNKSLETGSVTSR